MNYLDLTRFFLIVLTLTTASVAQATGPIIFSQLQKITITQEECLKKAETVMKNLGLSENFAKDNNALWGTKDKDSATGHIRCAATDGIVMLVVAGTSYSKASALFQSLQNDF